ncbi:MAG: serine hydrolase, partial [Clostridia bacterium]|nr:serine hydrolase [Clostridia bacterium]
MNFDKLRAYQDYLVNWRIPGNDCSVFKDHKEIYRYQAGYADKENYRLMRGDELYFFWSASKVITTSLGLRLLE